MEVLQIGWTGLAVARGRWALTLGAFDGVHRGHRAILESCRRIARQEGFEGAAAVTFVRHPRTVLAGQRPPRLLSSLPERLALLAESGLDRVVLLPFDAELAAMSHADFVRQCLSGKLAMAHFVLGHDVHFGKDRGGNIQTVGVLAEECGFSFSQVPSVRVDGLPISSSRIRDRIVAGAVEDAAELLGHPHLLSGIVQTGQRLGRQIGFPTANVVPESAGKLLPATGVYTAWARAEAGWLPAVVNVGRAPTVVAAGAVRVEAHLLDGDHELYGKLLTLALMARLREERKFADRERLRAQIALDVVAARRLLAARPAPADTLQVATWQRFAQEGGA